MPQGEFHINSKFGIFGTFTKFNQELTMHTRSTTPSWGLGIWDTDTPYEFPDGSASDVSEKRLTDIFQETLSNNTQLLQPLAPSEIRDEIEGSKESLVNVLYLPELNKNDETNKLPLSLTAVEYIQSQRFEPPMFVNPSPPQSSRIVISPTPIRVTTSVPSRKTPLTKSTQTPVPIQLFLTFPSLPCFPLSENRVIPEVSHATPRIPARRPTITKATSKNKSSIRSFKKGRRDEDEDYSPKQPKKKIW